MLKKLKFFVQSMAFENKCLFIPLQNLKIVEKEPQRSFELNARSGLCGFTQTFVF